MTFQNQNNAALKVAGYSFSTFEDLEFGGSL